jgi:methyl-accepting chemotaxis protein
MLTNLKIGTRLALGFGLVLILLLAVAGIGLNRMGAIETNTEQIVTHYNAQAHMARDLSEQVLVVSRQMRTLLLLDDPSDQRANAEAIAKEYGVYYDLLKTLEDSQWSQSGRELCA